MEKASSLREVEEAPARASGSGIVASRTSSVSEARVLRPVESGVFSAVAPPMTGEQLVESLQGALSAASRGEAGLGSLQRSMRDASRALTASRNAYESLTEELRVLYRGLNEALSEKAATERYVALLTQERDAALDAAEETRREAKREREFLLREQDRFIQLLLEEHEAEIAQLRRSLGRQTTPLAPATAAVLANAAAEADRDPGPASSQPILPSKVKAVVGGNKPVRVAVPPTQSEPFTPAGAETPATAQSLAQTQRSEAPPEVTPGGEDELANEPPAAPAVLDLDSLAAEVDGNSERPPPIRRIGGAEAKLHLKPARVPNLLDTLVSATGETEPHHEDSGPARAR